MENLMGACAKILDMSENDLSDSLIETKLESLDEDWHNVRTAYENVYLADDKAFDDDFKNVAKLEFESARDQYQLTKSNLMEVVKKRSLQKSTSSGREDQTNPSLFHSSAMYPPTTTFDMSEVCIKVPPCDTKDFHGSYEEWPTFRDMFMAIYGNHPRLTPAQKLYHLKNKTKGEAGRIVDRFSLSDLNFSLAWDALKKRYENKRVLVDNQLRILFEIAPAKNENNADIKRIQLTISDCLAILKAHDISVGEWDPILIYLCSTKLPIETLTLWEQSLESHADLPKWSQMEEFLINRQQVLERISRIKTQKAPQSSRYNFGAQYNTNTNSNRCILCAKNHILRNCPRFNNMSASQRIEVAKEKRLCNNCLASGHTSQECVSMHRCMQCRKKHHTKLHLTNNSQQQSSANIVARENNYIQSRTETHFTTDESSSDLSSGTNVQTLATINHDDVMLPTALVQIMHSGQKFTVRALLDSASKKTFITNKIVNRIGITTKKEDFQISGLSGIIVTNANKSCYITLCVDKTPFELEAEVIVVRNLTSLLPTRSLPNSNTNQIQDLKLADPGFAVSAQIDMLMGSDVLPSIMLNGIKKNVLGNMIAQNSIYGWYIYGPIEYDSMALATVEVSSKREEDIGVLLRKWEQEEVERAYIPTVEDEYCENFYKKTTCRRPDGRSEVKLPFKKEYPQSMFLESSRFKALRQYENMEK
ncbi:uncharacterized protein LOC133323285, partial [Musca vetustissima]|uniref:uncharacterized protein LOC133323285 n=1 Tax=Musca vetustissima TaxID=27455 RepID=UPI002AB7DC3E